jgi:hypothetical protein
LVVHKKRGEVSIYRKSKPGKQKSQFKKSNSRILPPVEGNLGETTILGGFA